MALRFRARMVDDLVRWGALCAVPVLMGLGAVCRTCLFGVLDVVVGAELYLPVGGCTDGCVR